MYTADHSDYEESMIDWKTLIHMKLTYWAGLSTVQAESISLLPPSTHHSGSFCCFLPDPDWFLPQLPPPQLSQSFSGGKKSNAHKPGWNPETQRRGRGKELPVSFPSLLLPAPGCMTGLDCPPAPLGWTTCFKKVKQP